MQQYRRLFTYLKKADNFVKKEMLYSILPFSETPTKEFIFVRKCLNIMCTKG